MTQSLQRRCDKTNYLAEDTHLQVDHVFFFIAFTNTRAKWRRFSSSTDRESQGVGRVILCSLERITKSCDLGTAQGSEITIKCV